jgi:hypothetical protein
MDIRYNRFISFAAAGMLAAATIVSAQTPAAGSQRDNQPSQQSQPAAERQPRMQVTPIEGELMDVDVEAKTFILMTDAATGQTAGVSTASENRIEFSYTDTTDVEDVDKGVAGLADRRATRMTVHFIEQDGKKVATRIELTPGTGPEATPGLDRPSRSGADGQQPR